MVFVRTVLISHFFQDAVFSENQDHPVRAYPSLIVGKRAFPGGPLPSGKGSVRLGRGAELSHHVRIAGGADLIGCLPCLFDEASGENDSE
jgi:hypothetical protein